MPVSKKWVLIIGVFFAALLYAQSWSGARWREYQGPVLLAKDQQGNLYIKIKSNILRYDAGGSYLDRRDLKDLGIEDLTGGIGFFPNGDLLMVPRSYSLNLLEELLVFYRITKQLPASLASNLTLARSARCKWQDLTCLPLPNFPKEFSQAFWVDIDADENIFLAHTTDHKVYWLDVSGNVLDVLEDASRIQFPNQLKRSGDFLWLANCNDNSLTKIPLLDKKFGANYQRFAARSPGLPESDRWPTGIAIMNDDYFVLAQGGNLQRGSIYRTNSEGELQNVFTKNVGDDPVGLTAFNGELLVADFMGLRIDRYNSHGEKVGVFTSPELQSILAEVRRQQFKYRRIESLFNALFWSMLLLGFGVAYFIEKRYKKSRLVTPPTAATLALSNNYSPSSNDERIRWLRYSFLYRNFNKWTIWWWMPLILLNVPLLFSAEEESVAKASVFLMLHGLALLGLINSHRLTNKQVGVSSPWVWLKSSDENISYAHEREILSYSLLGRTVLMIGNQDVLAKVGRHRKIFEGNIANDEVNRLITCSRSISLGERWAWLYEHKFNNLLWELLLAVLYGVILVAVNFHR